MADLSAAVLGRIVDGATIKLGTVGTVSPLVVAIDGAPMPAILADPIALAVGEPVTCALSGGVVWVLGSGALRPQSATVTASGGGTVAVSSGSWSMSGVLVLVGSPSIGSTVALVWGSEGVYALAATGAPTAPSPPAGVESPLPSNPAEMDAGRWEPATIDARPTAVRTSRSGAYRSLTDTGSSAYQGHYPGGISADNSGWFFYGGATDAAGIAESASIRLIRPRAAGDAGPVDFRLRLHTATTPGASPPTATADAEKPVALSWGDDVTYQLGAAWGQKLLDNAAAGIGLVYAGTTDYGYLEGPTATHPLAGQLIIRYRRQVS